MGSLLVVIAVAAVVFFWVRGARASRQRWVERLDLPGVWEWEEHDGSLEFAGGFSEGTYRLREAQRDVHGRWRLSGHLLELTPDSGPQVTFDLRFFDDGKIGLAAEKGDGRVYVKAPSNVVPLRPRRRGARPG